VRDGWITSSRSLEPLLVIQPSLTPANTGPQAGVPPAGNRWYSTPTLCALWASWFLVSCAEGAVCRRPSFKREAQPWIRSKR